LVFYLLIHRQSAGTKYFVSALIETLSESLAAAQEGRMSLESCHLAGKVADARIRRAIEAMEASLDSVSLADLARKCGISERNFHRLFHKETGIGPKDFLVRRRIEKAKRLLRKSKLTITDIAGEVGYQSLSKFIATFKRVEGLLPSDYRMSGRRS
jgi:AraC-like DNA-binding protein